mgnify:CR=1 FL=1
MICELRLAFVRFEYFNFKKNELDIEEAQAKIKARNELYEQELKKAREDFENMTLTKSPKAEASDDPNEDSSNMDSRTISDDSSKPSTLNNSLAGSQSKQNSVFE